MSEAALCLAEVAILAGVRSLLWAPKGPAKVKKTPTFVKNFPSKSADL